jgi:hypothetical protein
MSFLVRLPETAYRDDALKDFTVDPDFTLGNAQAMMWLSQLAYETDDRDKVKRVLKRFGLEMRAFGTNIPITGLLPRKACFIVAGGRGATFVTFAGTDPLKIQDWFTDLTVTPLPNVRHEGFVEAAKAVQPEIEAAIRSRGVAEQAVYFTGHSMGGALAHIAAMDSLEAGFRATAVYTFGGPRAGGQDFFNAYTPELGDRTFRLVHGEDIVATVPPSLGGDFRHVGRLLHCPHGSTFAGRTLAPNNGNDPNLIEAVLDAALDNGLRIPRFELPLNIDPRFLDQSPDLPIVLRDHVPANYFRALSIPLK